MESQPQSPQPPTTLLTTMESSTPPTEAPSSTKSTSVDVEKPGSPSQSLSLPRATDALKNLETSIGGRDKLIDRLIVGELDDKQRYLLKLLMDPSRSTESLARLCRDSGVKPSELVDLYRKSSFAVAQATAIGIAADAIPAITKDLADKSVDRTLPCPRCGGEKTVQILVKDKINTIRCDRCGGVGTIVRESELDRQKTVIDMLGLSGKGSGGINITQNNTQVAGGAVGALFSTFVKSTDRAAYDIAPDSIDGEVVK